MPDVSVPLIVKAAPILIKPSVERLAQTPICNKLGTLPSERLIRNSIHPLKGLLLYFKLQTLKKVDDVGSTIIGLLYFINPATQFYLQIVL